MRDLGGRRRQTHWFLALLGKAGTRPLRRGEDPEQLAYRLCPDRLQQPGVVIGAVYTDDEELGPGLHYLYSISVPK